MNAGPLDMRMDRQADRTAADIVNRRYRKGTRHAVHRVWRRRGKLAEKIARALVRARPIRDTRHLADRCGVGRAADWKAASGNASFSRPCAWRSTTNRPNWTPAEAGARIPEAGGRWVVIAFQSLDDRKVRTFSATWGARVKRRSDEACDTAGAEEVRRNPASAQRRAEGAGNEPGRNRQRRDGVRLREG